jgi:hypothetical protein
MSDSNPRTGRSIAQWFCLIFGITLIIVGLLGFLVEPKFDTSVGGDPGQVDGEDLIIFEVNGWHNVVHLLSGIFLLVFAGRRRPARMAALAFGVVYVIVSIIGLIDGQDLFGLVPIDRADNVLHIVLALTAIAAGLMSRGEDEDRDIDRSGRRTGVSAGSAAAVEQQRTRRDPDVGRLDNRPEAGGTHERPAVRPEEPRGQR